MLLSMSLEDSLLFVIPFLITGSLTVLMFGSAFAVSSKELTLLRVALIVFGLLFLIATLGIGACFGIMWDFRLDTR